MAGPEIALVMGGLQLMQGFQGYQQGKAQAKIAQQTAAYNADVTNQQYVVEQQSLQKQQRIFASQQRARAATTGADLSSFEDTFEDTSNQSLLDQALLDYDRRTKVNQILYGGQVEAAQARAKGKQALISGIIGAGKGIYKYEAGPNGGGWSRSASGEPIYWNSGSW